jgi:hypothetical protein
MLMDHEQTAPVATDVTVLAAAPTAHPGPANGNLPAKIVAPGSTTPDLHVNDLDERGSTVEYIYAKDPDYIVYYSRLRRPAGEAGGWPRLHWRRRKSDAAGSHEREGVQAQLSLDPRKRQEQRTKLLQLGTRRAKLLATLSGWPRRESYDASIATALQLALDGDGDGASLKTALDTLDDALAAIQNERALAGRSQYVLWALICACLGFVVLSIAGETLLQNSGKFWLGTQAGLLGAVFSIAIGIRNRTVAPNNNRAGNLADGALRLVIGAVSGGTLVLLFSTGLVPALHTHVGDMDGDTSIPFVVLLGIIAGFVEQLVPGILKSEAGKIGSDEAPAGDQAKASPK